MSLYSLLKDLSLLPPLHFSMGASFWRPFGLIVDALNAD